MLEKINLDILIESMGDENYVKNVVSTLVESTIKNRCITSIEVTYKDYRVSYKKG